MVRRTTKDRDADRLAVGDECWFLDGNLLYEVTVTDVNVCLVGEPQEFVMYRVEPNHDIYSYLRERSIHRSDLFRRPSEVEELRERIESDINSLNYLLNELENVGAVAEEGA